MAMWKFGKKKSDEKAAVVEPQAETAPAEEVTESLPAETKSTPVALSLIHI